MANTTLSMVISVIFSTVAVAVPCFAQSALQKNAAELNNTGVAQMGQQFTAKAAASFAEALKTDPKLAQAAINEGIALLTLQKLDEAKSAFQQAIALDPKSAQAYYNLGLAQRFANEMQPALTSFLKAAALAPTDADTHYFVGACYLELKQYKDAIAAFHEALILDPTHASAEFGLARALQRDKNIDEAREHFARFQHLTSAKISSAIGVAYGEQGRYSLVEPVVLHEPGAASMIPVKLLPETLDNTLKRTTGGACMIDATGSGQMDLVLLQSGPQAIAILHRSSEGNFTRLDVIAAGLKASGNAIACAIGDYDNDGLNDLAVAFSDSVAIFHNLGKGRFEDLTAEANISAKNHPTGITFIDFDHDGDLDLLLTGSPLHTSTAATVLWRNNGNKTFTEWSEPVALDENQRTSAAILTDFNNDRAVDFVVTGDSASPLLYVNPREGKYAKQRLYSEKLPSTQGIAVSDFNKDGWMDIAVTHSEAPGLTLWRNVAGVTAQTRTFQRVALPLKDAERAWGITPIDIDNDGWVDLAAVVEMHDRMCVRVLRNRGDGTFEDVSSALGLDSVLLTSPHGLIAADIDNDGAADLIVTQDNAAPVLLRNQGASKNHFARLDLTGFADNKTSLGVKVEIFAGGLWQKFELAGSVGYQTQAPPQVLVGLGEADHIDLLRILWPTGVLQDEIDLPHTRVIAMTEADRRGSSCPVLFTWDGSKYKFVTDVIGAAVVGHWFTPSRRNIANPGEWVKVNGSDLAPVNHRMSLRFMEPMEEVNYIDQLRLVAIDHPEDVRVNPDERFLDDPPFASGKVIASKDVHPPAGAWDGNGHDVLDMVSHQDHKFASGFTLTAYDGFANLHALTLDLGALKVNSPLRLLMTGYVNYFSATSLYGAWQAGIHPIAPYIEAQRQDGRWQRVTAGEAGFPAGLERTIVIDLTGKLPEGARRIRLMSNLLLFWDQVLIDQSADAAFQTHELPLTTATLRFRGFPTQIEGKSPGDLDYDYDRVSLTGPYQHQRGNYTRMGDVTELLQGIDNRFAIFGSGEEIAADFDSGALPPLPPHWTRDFFFYANGYVKDMDWWDASPFTVTQLPFHGMSSYPYPPAEHFPEDNSTLAYQLDWNTRFDSGEPVRSYRFNYQMLPSTPADDTRVQPSQDVDRAASPSGATKR